jgi:hypothetical protein
MRTALNFPCIVHLTSRRALVWGITPICARISYNLVVHS